MYRAATAQEYLVPIRSETSQYYNVTGDVCTPHKSLSSVAKGSKVLKALDKSLIRVQVLLYSGLPILNETVSKVSHILKKAASVLPIIQLSRGIVHTFRSLFNIAATYL